MSAFLDAMANRSRERAKAAAHSRPEQDLREEIAMLPAPRPLARFGAEFDVIAEVKPASPSEGVFPERDPVEAALGYESGGAGMISVLTEPSAFGGSLGSLRAVARAVSIPVMAKDFLVEPYQVLEARDSGADGVLIIARILSDEALGEMIAATAALGMFALLEAFDHVDLARLGEAARGRRDMLIGVNSRDLDTLEVEPGRHRALAENLPEGHVTVAESGLTTEEDLERVAALGYDAGLVGSALMRSHDPVGAVRSMVGSGRSAAVATR